MTSSTKRRAAGVAVLVVSAIAAVWLIWPDNNVPVATAPPVVQAIAPGTAFRSAACHRPVTAPFAPSRITVPGITKDARVFGLPRDANNVPTALSLSSPYAKTGFAWDQPTIKPGEAHGNVLLNTHTWPDDSSLGNHLLDHLSVGGRIIVRGDAGQEICYKVTKRYVILAADGSKEYYAKGGPPQIAVIVCSPPRLGPGNWKNRTIWLASPVGSPLARAVAAS